MIISSKAAGRIACMLLMGGLVWPVAISSAEAQQQVNSDQIIKALTPAPVTRSLSAKPADSPTDQAFIEGLRHRTRSLSADESEHVAEIAKDKPKIDLDIYFDYNSAMITPKAAPQLEQLGKALKDPQFANSFFVLGGHTDAKGGDDYNKRLSERRAESVKRYLIAKMKLSPDSLTTAGYGKRDLKNPSDPFAAENRRVQVVNLGPSQAQR
ncbi:MAG: OmpA family protein [Caulobacteraceae bacterium]|nr:OmpA family protein [Caulobacteraceae bacterium]